jgi:serine/threonine protein kinase
MAAGCLQKISKIGEGTYGVVYRGHPESHPETIVAIKRNIVDRETNFIGSLKELDILNQLRGHPYIVDLVAVAFGDPFQDQLAPKSRDSKSLMTPLKHRDYKDDMVHFVMEYAKYGDGHRYIRSNNTSIDVLKRGMVQILLALEYIHGKGIIHRDLKPQNLLIFENPSSPSSSGPIGPSESPGQTDVIFKLTDFGLSKPYTNQGRQTPRMVTSWYRAPEICLEWPNYGPKADVWSLGCVFFEMVSGKPLLRVDHDVDATIVNRIFSVYPEAPSKELLTKMFRYRTVSLTSQARATHRKSWRDRLGLNLERQAKFNETPGTYDEFIDLLNHLLVVDPDHRWTATQALNHPFFQSQRHHINEIRTQYPPIPVESSSLRVIECSERKWASEVAFMIYNGRATLSWYKHRIMFQALDLFDRYLNWAETNLTPKTEISGDQGKFHNRYQAELRFMVCLYISIKYFTTMYIPLSYLSLANDFYKTPEALKEAERFETEMLTLVLQFCIYRETLYEVADAYGHILDESQIRDLLMIQGSLTSYYGLTPKEVYRLYLVAKGMIPSDPGETEEKESLKWVETPATLATSSKPEINMSS